MSLELAFTPSGRIKIQQSKSQSGKDDDLLQDISDRRLANVVKAFASSSAAGLFELAANRLDTTRSPSFVFWRDFAGRYLSNLCQVPDGVNTIVPEIPPPESDELELLLSGIPPMPGAEYVSSDALKTIWQELDMWVHDEIRTSGKGLADFLTDRAPLWHQVGRVCFHLAENRRDPDYPFAFLATYAPGITSGGRVQYQPLSKALEQYSGAKHKNALIKLLSPVHLASQASSLVKDLVETGDLYHPLAWTPRQAYNFLQDVPKFEQSGVLVRLPDWWKKRPRPMVSVTIGDNKNTKLSAGSMLDFQVRIALGNQKLSEEEWQQLLSNEDGLVLLRGQWVEVDSDKLSEALEHWKQVEQQAEEGVSFIDGMRMLAGASSDLTAESEDSSNQRDWSFVDAGEWLGKILTDLRSPENLQHTQSGTGLQATLRKYQETGVNWLYLLSGLGLGSCLADDMGLGKTIQVLALLLALKEEKVKKPSLLVVPASLLGNWKAELEKFAPSLKACFVHPSQTPKKELEQIIKNPGKALKQADVAVTTYGTLLRQSWLLEVEWKLAVLDEAQAIKNPTTRQTKTIKQLKTESRIALTGTPVENRMGDLWSLFDFLCPGLLGSQEKFKKFVKSLEERTTDRYAPLRRLVGPYILRRLKTDKKVISDLPDKTEVRANCGLSKRQVALYTKLVGELSDALGDVDGIKRRGLVLAYMMRFKQLCNHPGQLLGAGNYSPEDSGKFIRLGEICEEIAARQEKVLVFTQFREMTNPLADYLSSVFGHGGLVLHGGTPVKRRQKLVREFQQEDGPGFLVLSLKAGGTGLNLTAASHVIHFDRWWNPAVENQATDRAFRIGQKRNVLVHKFVCQGTMEEKIDSLITEKSQMAADLLETDSEKMLTEMTNDELIQLVSLDVDRVSL